MAETLLPRQKYQKQHTTQCNVQIKFILGSIKHHVMKAHGGVEIYLHSLLISALDGTAGQVDVPKIVCTGKEPSGSTEQKHLLRHPEIEPHVFRLPFRGLATKRTALTWLMVTLWLLYCMSLYIYIAEGKENFLKWLEPNVPGIKSIHS
jgi:hypothetical protein